jgi:class 3 adenylate cyclase/putative methionine-R-sulfoxide reductase with GAF domain
LGGAADLETELAESRAREAALAEILAVISRSTTDLEPVFEAILRKTLELAHADTAAIQLREGDVFRGVAGMGQTAHEDELDKESARRGHDFIRPGTRTTLTGRVAAEGQTVQIPDIATDEEYDKWSRELPGVERTMLGVPLVHGREVIGVVIARRRIPNPFSAREIALLEAFAHQAVIAVQNVRLFSATQASLERQTAISEVLKDMSHSVFDLERVLESVAMNAVRLCAADNGSIAQLKNDGWRLVANVGDIDEENMEKNWVNRPIDADRRSLTGRVLMDRRTTTIVDALADPEYDTGVGVFNVRSLIGVPLTRGDDIVGVLILRRQEPKPFTPEEIHLLETFADQASIAIENIELFRTVERQRSELSRFLSPQVAALITSDEGAKMLEGHRRQITVVFCDLRGFTAFAETAEPEEVLGVLRDYHRAMGELIVEHQGTLEHFAGDGMMVFFNDPLPVERHELEAVRMSVAMRARFDEMARGWQRRGYELGFGVGIATGYATLGRIGFEGRYDYGAVGNVVILAQRLSAEAKGGQILLSQRVHAAVETDVETTEVGDLTLKGFTRPVPAFAAESVKTPTPARS